MAERQTDEQPGRKARARAIAALAVFCVVAALIYLVDPVDLALWAKALHVIAVMSWMAGLLYLPRLFIYHTDAEIGSVQSETFKVMERRLFTLIMTPAMVLSWVLGLYVAWTLYGFSGGWLHAKLVAVVALSGIHEYFGSAVRAFGADKRPKTARFWRMANEGPTILMIVIVILVVVKPF